MVHPPWADETRAADRSRGLPGPSCSPGAEPGSRPQLRRGHRRRAGRACGRPGASRVAFVPPSFVPGCQSDPRAPSDRHTYASNHSSVHWGPPQAILVHIPDSFKIPVGVDKSARSALPLQGASPPACFFSFRLSRAGPASSPPTRSSLRGLPESRGSASRTSPKLRRASVHDLAPSKPPAPPGAIEGVSAQSIRRDRGELTQSAIDAVHERRAVTVRMR